MALPSTTSQKLKPVLIAVGVIGIAIFLITMVPKLLQCSSGC